MIITVIISGYAAIISTLSFVLASRAYRAGGPITEIHWEYSEKGQELTLDVVNKGRADVTISGLELFVLRDNEGEIMPTKIGEIPRDRWCASHEIEFPIRMSANSMISVKTNRKGIESSLYQFLPGQLTLEFCVKTPHGKRAVWVGGAVFNHFTSLNPKWSITSSRGSRPLL